MSGGIQVSFGEITEKNLGQLKILNAAILPVRYNDKFYQGLLHHLEYSKLAFHTDILVGAVCCRLEMPNSKAASPPVGGVTGPRLYIMTLGVLAPYRRLGIGTKLLEFVLQVCKEKPEIEAVYLHVQTNNEAAIAFYNKFGFEIADTIKDYYKRIEPPDCYVLQKKLK